MAEMMTTDVRALLDRTPFDHSAVADLREVLGRDPSRYRTLRDAVAAMRDREKGAPKPETHLRLGVGEVLLGRYQSGLDHLAKAGDVGLAHFHRGLALENLQRWNEAAEAFAAAAKAGYDAKQAELHRAGALRRAGQDRRGPEDPRRRSRSWPAARPSTTTSAAACSPPTASSPPPPPSSRRPSASTATTPAPCSSWPTSTTSTATTRPPSTTTSAARRGRPSRWPR